MLQSRGMGSIDPSKMPGPKRKARRDDTDFTEYAKGGEVWDKPRPKGLGAPKALSPQQKASAKAQAKAKGQVYPSLVANMRAARK